MYYPRMDLSYCQSLPNPKILSGILDPPSVEVDWNKPGQLEKFQELVKTRNIVLRCAGAGDPYPVICHLL